MKPFKAALCLLSLVVVLPNSAGAAHRKIEFPSSDADRIIKVNLFPSKKPERPALNRQREARLQVIAELFTRTNPKLTQKRARDYAEYLLQAGEKFGQDPFVLAAMIVHESTARYDAVSRGGDYGLMQVRWSVHKKRIMRDYPNVKTARDILDPKTNILIGTEIFSDYRAAVGTDLRAGLLRYSAGNRKLANKIFATKDGLEKAYQKRLNSK
ncbi:MAG: transglycosylase SLT domain-containing protein [Synergistaceae bacterium]|nr:transglycosylase SLT domain-containing protein [Synergistaceae bacterium]